MEEQDKAMARKQSETDISSMPNEEFKATIMRIITGLEKRREDISEILITEMKSLKKESVKDEEYN